MNRILIGLIIAAVMMLVGCNKAATEPKVVTSPMVDEQKEDLQIEKTEQPAQAVNKTSSSENVKTYEDEANKDIVYGKLTLNTGSYHVVSETSKDNVVTYKCEIDKGTTRPKKSMFITIQDTKKQELQSLESIIAYLRDISPDYENILIYSNVTDNSGITDLYSVEGVGLTKYIVCYSDACYLMESDYNILDSYLFQNNPSADYQLKQQKIECANSHTALVNKTFSSKDNKVEYYIVQGKDETKHSAQISLGEGQEYKLAIKNEHGEPLLTLSTFASNIDDVVKFLDVNLDGYADIQFLNQEGALNNIYDLYIWDELTKNFVKVKCEDMLSNFEVHDGYLVNYVKDDIQSGVMQKLIWDKDTLIKKSEEPYQTN